MSSWYSLPVTACGAAGAVSVVMGRSSFASSGCCLLYYRLNAEGGGLSAASFNLLLRTLRLSRGPHREHFFAPRSFFLRLPDDVRRDVELHHSARAYSFFSKARREVIVCFSEPSAVVEGPLVLKTLPADLRHLLRLYRLAIQQAVEFGDVFQARLEELTEAGRVAYRVHQL